MLDSVQQGVEQDSKPRQPSPLTRIRGTYKNAFGGVDLSWLLALLLCTAILLAVYAPTLLYVYDFHDGFLHYRLSATRCDTHPQWVYMLAVGRPIYDFANCFLTDHLIATPADNYKIRLVGIAALCCCAAYVCGQLRRRGLNLPYSVLLASAIFSLPGWQLEINFTCDVANIAAALLTIPAFHLLARDGGSALLKLSGAAALLLVAALTFQQMMPLLFVWIAIDILLNNDALRARRLLAGGIIAFALAGIAYLPIHSFVLVPYVEHLIGMPLAQLWPQMMHAQAIKLDPQLAAEYMVSYLPGIFSLWFMNFADWVWLLPAAAFALGAAALILRPAKSGNPTGLEVGIWLVIIFGMVNALSILSLEPIPRQHHDLPYEAFIVVVIALGLFRFAAGRALVAALLCAGLVYSGWSLKRNAAEPNAAELRYVAASIARYDTATRPKLCIALSPFTDLTGYRLGPRTPAEIGGTTTMWESDAAPIIFAAAKMVGIDPRKIEFAKDFAVKPSQTIPPDCGFVIDMPAFQRGFLATHSRS
jgi:hypothetical protein